MAKYKNTENLLAALHDFAAKEAPNKNSKFPARQQTIYDTIIECIHIVENHQDVEFDDDNYVKLWRCRYCGSAFDRKYKYCPNCGI